MLEFLVLAGIAALSNATGKKPSPVRRRERLIGGKGDHRNPRDFDRRELAMGIRHEMEHTKSRAVAREIAVDHLTEHRDYYRQLRRAERRMAGPTPKSR